MGALESRYAEGLLAAAANTKEADRFGEGLRVLSDVLKGDFDSHVFFTAPHISVSLKRKAVEQIFLQSNGAEWQLLANFIFLLIDKNRIGNLPEIEKEYVRLRDERRNHLEIKLSSAMPLEAEQVKAVTERLVRQYGAAGFSVTQKVDPSLIGGLLIQIGDIRIDDTQSRRLRALKQSIAGTM